MNRPARPGGDGAAEALLGTPLLHLEERYRSRYDWWKWFARHGVEVSGGLPGYRSNELRPDAEDLLGWLVHAR